MIRSPTAALSPDPSDRKEPSLAETPVPSATPRLVPAERSRATPRLGLRASVTPELRAGERSVVVSSSGAASERTGVLLRRAALIALCVLALVGAGSLVERFVGL
jgi:hypothetical protein